MLYRSIVGILVAANLIAGAGLLARWARSDDATTTTTTVTEADDSSSVTDDAASDEAAQLAAEQDAAEAARIAEEDAEARLAEEERLAAEEEARLAEEQALADEEARMRAEEEQALVAEEEAAAEAEEARLAEEEAAAAADEAAEADALDDPVDDGSAEDDGNAEDDGAEGDGSADDGNPTTGDIVPGVDPQTVLSSVELVAAEGETEVEQTIDTSVLWSGDDLPTETGFRETFVDDATPIVEPGTQYSIDWQIFSLTTGQLVESTYELYPDGTLPVYTIGDGEQPAALEDTLTGRPIESDYLIVYPEGMSDLPTNLASDDAYVLYVQVYQYFPEN